MLRAGESPALFRAVGPFITSDDKEGDGVFREVTLLPPGRFTKRKSRGESSEVKYSRGHRDKPPERGGRGGTKPRPPHSSQGPANAGGAFRISGAMK